MKRPLVIAAFIICLSLGFLGGRYWTLQSLGASIDWPVTFEAWANIAQTIALAVAGWWTYRLFVRQRVEQVRADITHDVQRYALGNENCLVRVVIHIKNVGNIEIRPPSGRTVLQHADFKPATQELIWEKDDERDLPFKADSFTLEPSETERYSVDFIVPLTRELLQIHTYVRCGSSGDDFWDESTLFIAKLPERGYRK